jgi:accessory gene regulator B
MEAMITKIAESFVEKGIASEKDKSIYEFGLKQGTVIIINLITVLLIGLVSGELWNLMVFTISYLLLQPYAGGYHAESEIGCYVFSTLMMIVVVFVSKFIMMDFHVVAIILGCSVSILMLFAPVEDYRKSLDEMEVKVYRRKLQKVLFVELVGIAGTTYIANHIAQMIAIAIIAITFLVVLGACRKLQPKC